MSERSIYMKNYFQKNRGKKLSADSKYRQSEKGKSRNRKYAHSEKGKLASRKHYAKRERNLGYIQMFKNPFTNKEKIEWHHITDVYVIAIPKDLHHLYGNHRENIMEIVKQIYLGENNE